MARRMTTWETDVRRGMGVGIGLAIFIVLLDVAALWWVIHLAGTYGTITFWTFVVGLGLLFSLFLLGLMAYWLYGLFLSRYLLDRNELVIQWGAVQQVIPMGQVEVVFTGEEVEGPILFNGGKWPGHCVGFGQVPIPGGAPTPAMFYGTVSPKWQIYVATPGLVYGISPAQRDDFLESLQKRMEMGPTQVVEQVTHRPGFLGWGIWRDRLALGLLVFGILSIFALIGLVTFRYPSLDLVIPLHFDAAGTPDRWGSRVQVFITPLIGVLTMLFNGVLGGLAYRRERMISYLLWGGAVLVQVLVWTATVGLLWSR
ncbi:MAG: DUF1648 domain-containing protein [Anaerolineae bacterium]|nr:DUF1648 domain-containing protein [Anaerolineae bacterium]